jgi:quercetin 2,3-dioxygenase
MLATQKFRSVQKVMKRPPKHWVGDGFHVYPVFNDMAFTEVLSPLLMFDYGAPQQFAPRPGKAPLGVGQHPHRGFETVTVAFQGEAEHSDSTGKTGVIKEGDVQWMTAGRGIIHEEYHSRKFTENGGTLEMCQLWVNLPKQYKMVEPRYQPILKNDIPVVSLPLGSEENTRIASARIIAGELGNTKGAAMTFSPVQMWDVNIPKSGATVEIPFPEKHNCIVFVRRGIVEIMGDHQSSTKLNPQDVALMERDGSTQLRLRIHEDNSSVLILGGEPLNEPIAAQGPFVMNTQAELRQAFADYRSGDFGR